MPVLSDSHDKDADRLLLVFAPSCSTACSDKFSMFAFIWQFRLVVLALSACTSSVETATFHPIPIRHRFWFGYCHHINSSVIPINNVILSCSCTHYSRYASSFEDLLFSSTSSISPAHASVSCASGILSHHTAATLHQVPFSPHHAAEVPPL